MCARFLVRRPTTAVRDACISSTATRAASTRSREERTQHPHTTQVGDHRGVGARLSAGHLRESCAYNGTAECSSAARAAAAQGGQWHPLTLACVPCRPSQGELWIASQDEVAACRACRLPLANATLGQAAPGCRAPCTLTQLLRARARQHAFLRLSTEPLTSTPCVARVTTSRALHAGRGRAPGQAFPHQVPPLSHSQVAACAAHKQELLPHARTHARFAEPFLRVLAPSDASALSGSRRDLSR